MNTQDGGLYYVPRIDIEKLRADVERMKRQFESVNKKAREETSKTQQTIDTMLKGAMAYLTIQQAKNFASEVINIRGQFQQLGVAFETMLGNKAKADKLMADVVDFASKTPFQLTEVAGGTKQLLAYKLSAEEVLPTLKALGDVSAGLSVPIERLILNYGQVKTASKLTGRELRDFNMAGVPLISELAKNLNKSETAIQDMVSAGKIGFKDVENAFKTMTNEGGHFANLMDKQSATITGKISNLYDVIDEKLNEIGTSSEGIINASIDSASYLVENYEAIAREIGGLVVMYGAYRGALIATSVVQKVVTASKVGMTTAEIAHYTALVVSEKAQKALNITMMANPYAIVAVSVATLTYALYKHITAQSEAEQVQEALNNRIKEQSELAEKERGTLNSLIGTIKDETATRFQKQQALENLQKQFPDIFKNMDIEAVKIANITDLLKEYNKQRDVKNALSDEEDLKQAKEDLENLGSYRSKSQEDKKRQELTAKIKSLEKKIEQRKRTEENARFSGLSDADKIKELEAKNEKLNKSLDNDNPASLTKGLINDQIQKNNKLIAGYKKNIETAKNVVLTSVSSLRKAIAKENEKINELRGKNGLTEAEEKKLTDAIATKKQLEDKLNNIYIGKKPSKTKKTTKENNYDAEKVKKELKRKEEDIQYELAKSKLEAEKDSYKKSYNLLELEGNRKLLELERQKEDAIALLKRQRVEDSENNIEYDSSFWDKKIETVETVYKQRIDVQSGKNKDEFSNLLKELTKQYATYEERRVLLSEEAQQKINSLIEKGEKEGNKDKYSKNIKKITSGLNKDLYNLEKKYGGSKSIIARMFGDATELTTKQLRELVKEAETFVSVLEEDEASHEYIDELKERLKGLKDNLEDTEPLFKRIQKNIKKIFNDQTPDKDKETAIEKLIVDLELASNSLGLLADGLEAVGKLSGSKAFEDIAGGLTKIMNVVNDAISGAKMGASLSGGNAYAAIAGAVIGLISSAAKAVDKVNKKHNEVLKSIRESAIRQRTVYNQLLFEQKMMMEDSESIFGVNAISKALGYLEAYNQAYESLQNKIKRKKRGAGGRFGSISIGRNNMFSSLKREQKSMVSELDKIQVKTGSRTTGMWWWKKQHDILSSITDVYKDLVDEEGNLNVERAKAIMQEGQLNEEGKANLQDIIDKAEQMKEARKQFDSYLKDTFGELGDGMLDSVINSLKTGEDVFKSFGKSVGNVIGKLGKQLMYELFVSERFKQLKKDIEKEYKKGGKGRSKESIAKGVQQLVTGFANGMKGEVNAMKDFAKTWQEETKEMGFDIWGTENKKREAISKGFASMTQDQASNLDGRFATMQSHTYQLLSISENMKWLRDNSGKKLKLLTGIETNTARLQKIETDIGSMKSGIEDINDKGIKIRR